MKDLIAESLSQMVQCLLRGYRKCHHVPLFLKKFRFGIIEYITRMKNPPSTLRLQGHLTVSIIGTEKKRIKQIWVECVLKNPTQVMKESISPLTMKRFNRLLQKGVLIPNLNFCSVPWLKSSWQNLISFMFHTFSLKMRISGLEESSQVMKWSKTTILTEKLGSPQALLIR